jgi:hypothetical protein
MPLHPKPLLCKPRVLRRTILVNHYAGAYWTNVCLLCQWRHLAEFSCNLEDIIEVKLMDKETSKHLKYYAERLKPRRAIELVLTLDHPYQKYGIEVMNL